MPHLKLQSFPKNLTEDERASLRDDLVSVIRRHLKSGEDAISIDYEEVEPSAWNGVVDRDIRPNLGRLLKKPGYAC